MKKLEATFVPSVTKTTSLQEISVLLNGLERHAVDTVPWREFDYKPEVSFAIAHSEAGVLLKYFVKEKNAQAIYKRINDPVYKDSCVEFFLALEGEKAYYNFEFNCIGTCLLEFGPARANRSLLPETTIEKIKYLSDFKGGSQVSEAEIPWSLTVIIPVEVFYFHKLSSLRGKTCRANFYKCGEGLRQPHYVTWNHIDAPRPDFHLYEYFGEVHFKA
jgi:hypothetical protein